MLLEHILESQELGLANHIQDAATGAAMTWAEFLISGNVMQAAFHYNRFMALCEAFDEALQNGIGL